MAMLLSACSTMTASDLSLLQHQVFAVEHAFARGKAERKFDDFVRPLSEHAVSFGSRDVRRCKADVAARWKLFHADPQAPFSWEPDQMEVSPDGLLAHASGAVRDPTGKLISQFNSI